jgi:hypothetical protein
MKEKQDEEDEGEEEEQDEMQSMTGTHGAQGAGIPSPAKAFFSLTVARLHPFSPFPAVIMISRARSDWTRQALCP